MMLHPASELQQQASDPSASTWVHANAGTGKTKVLIDRVARLLLSGVEPQHILCLTYTKAAAAEMQNRLFERLGTWAMKPDDALRRELRALGDGTVATAPTLALARQLFARAIETPGGLRIQTIHSFCAALLRRFPLEAGVTPQFTELDDRSASLLREEVAEDIGSSPEMQALAKAFTGDDFSDLLQRITGRRALFMQPLDVAACQSALGIAADTHLQDVVDAVFLPDVAEWISDVIAHLERGKATDVGLAKVLRKINFAAPDVVGLMALENAVLTGAVAKSGPFTAKIGKLPTKDTRPLLGNRLPDLENLMLRVESARPRRLGLATLAKTEALHAYAQLFLPLYAAKKAARGWLDFDDLIMRAHALLTDTAVAQWVLYRLDGGIDHILVDEAQDTNPLQWQVIDSLAAEFTSGQGARDVARTIFVVGDKKQSIYSFQGADVASFDRMRADFELRLQGAAQALVKLDLEHSFRSSPVILGLVDKTFDNVIREDLGGQMKHLAYHTEMPGRVDLWPPELPIAKTADEDWTDPVDLLTDDHHAVRIGRRVADFIAGVVAEGTQIPIKAGGGLGERLAGFGDFLVLVKRRSEVFHEIIRACKAKGLPIAGADRLRLGGELAVKDLAALLSFLCSDMDDLSLASVLRSPLCGWSEAQLYTLAQPRTGLLWEALREAKETYPDTHAMLTDLRDQADFLRPYDLIERVLTRHHGRQRLLARLGEEAEDGIDELLSQALAYERHDVPSLTGFLEWLVTDDIEVKRQPEGAGDKIRIMTVHGAKGLEAPIVILPDTADHQPQEKDKFISMRDGPVVWLPNKADRAAILKAESDHYAALRKAERNRLLYVAMTRAQSWLIVAAAGTVEQADCWYRLLAMGMEHAGARVCDDGVMILEGGSVWPANKTPGVQTPLQRAAEPWMVAPAPKPMAVPLVLSPSGLGGAKALPGEAGQSEDMALSRGSALHVLLETLPRHAAPDWRAIADRIPGMDDALFAEASAILAAPSLSHVFTANTLAEVGITASVGSRRLAGSIDRLVITDDHVLAVDFKSNRIVPETPAAVPLGILRQMGAYAAALQQIYPGKRIDTAVVWTRTATLMMLPDDLITAALVGVDAFSATET
jgi:ATP-dependent helicase/nuclease subunit A